LLNAGPQTWSRLRSDDLHVSIGRARQRLEVPRVRRDDAVAVRREENEGSIDHIGAAYLGEQRSGGAAELVVERSDLDPGEYLRKERLSPTATPHLTHDPAVRHDRLLVAMRFFQSTPDRAVGAVERDERAAVEDESQAAPRLRAAVRALAGEGEPWTRAP
jgi:hypothetical protein